MNSKLIKELQTLIEEDVISIEVADKIEEFYLSKTPQKSNRLLTVFGIIGSLLMGLGIILILAHNWDDFSKITKTILAFTPLLIGQCIVGYSILRKKSQTWLEASGVFLFFAVGSCISLISQIYNIPGSLHTFLLSWILLCIPLVYLLKSKGVFLLILLFSTIYACDLGYSFSGIRKTPWMYLIVIAALVPGYAAQLQNEKSKNSTAILNWLFPLSFTIVFGAFLNGKYQIEFLCYTLFFGLLYNMGKLNVYQQIRLSKNGFTIIGTFGIIISLLFMSFESFWSSNVDFSLVNTKEIIISVLIVLSSLYIAFKNKVFYKQLSFHHIYQLLPLIIIGIYISYFIDDSIATILINISILTLGINTVIKGIHTINFALLNFGLLTITALIITRFLDSDLTFIARGLLFILVGASFFIANYIMVKKNNNKQLKR